MKRTIRITAIRDELKVNLEVNLVTKHRTIDEANRFKEALTNEIFSTLDQRFNVSEIKIR